MLSQNAVYLYGRNFFHLVLNSTQLSISRKRTKPASLLYFRACLLRDEKAIITNKKENRIQRQDLHLVYVSTENDLVLHLLNNLQSFSCGRYKRGTLEIAFPVNLWLFGTVGTTPSLHGTLQNKSIKILEGYDEQARIVQ